MSLSHWRYPDEVDKKKAAVLCGVWLVMVEIEEVSVQILYGELP
jgi:hypothetical protein